MYCRVNSARLQGIQIADALWQRLLVSGRSNRNTHPQLRPVSHPMMVEVEIYLSVISAHVPLSALKLEVNAVKTSKMTALLAKR